jgi:ABC-2 type transport system ATP-binding protein
MADTTDNVVEAENLTKVFRDFWHRPKVTAVREVSFSIRRGEVFGLLGPNGSGKSTTLKMILGLLHPTRGRLTVLGRSPRDVKAKARLGYLPEESYLYPYLTAEETLSFYGKLFDLNGRERRDRMAQLLDMIGLQHARSRLVGEFSKGMARRIGLAQALINDPDLVVLDEPTSGLDPIGCRQVKDLIVTLARRGKTVLLSSHLLADVEDVCDRVAILYNGRVQAMGPIGELLEERSRYRVNLPGDLAPEALQAVLAEVRRVLGAEPSVEHPRRDLEQFFLDVVEKARKEAKESSGVGQAGGVATYLAAPADSRSVDEQLNELVNPTTNKHE